MFREVPSDPEGHLAPPSAPAAPGSLALTAGWGKSLPCLGKEPSKSLFSSLPWLGPRSVLSSPNREKSWWHCLCNSHPRCKKLISPRTRDLLWRKGFLEQRTLAQTRFCSRNFSRFSHRLLNMECPHQEGPYTGYLPSAPSSTHPLIISFIHSSIHVCTLTHTEKHGGQGLISECLSQSCLHLVSFNFITFMYVCM